MAVVTVRHTVADYEAWKVGYDAHAVSRKEHGATNAQVLQSIEDPNDVVVLIEFGSLEEAKGFTSDPSLKDAMAAAGVVGAPDISFRERTDGPTY